MQPSLPARFPNPIFRGSADFAIGGRVRKLSSLFGVYSPKIEDFQHWGSCSVNGAPQAKFSKIYS